jgi:hypothetical protein
MILRQLSRTELTWARDAFDAIFPSQPSGAPGVGAMNIEGYLQDTFARIPLEPVCGLRIAIWIVALAPLFVLGRLATIHGLSKPDRERVLVGLTMSPVYAVRQLVVALKAMAALLYAGDPSVRARLLAARSDSPSRELVPLARKSATEPAKTPSVPPPGPSGGRRVVAA